MAVVSTLSNHMKYMQGTKKIDFANDSFKIILMDTSFAFDKDAHATLADVSASEVATLFGYTQQTKVLAGVVVTEDDSGDKLNVTWDDPSWTASGGNLAGQAIGAAIVYDDTTTDDTVIGCIDFGTDLTVPDAIVLQIQDIEFDNE